jgi:hypothetical protein
MKEYWTAIDDAFARLDCHSGGFHAVHLVYTPEFLARLKSMLDRAAAAAAGDAMHEQRVALHTEGWRSAADYARLRDAVNAGDFAEARRVYDAFLARLDGLAQKGWANREYASAYLKRFIGPMVAQGDALLHPPARLLAVLPDEWKLAYEADDPDLAARFPDPAFDDAAWRRVSTFGRTLSAQGLPDRREAMWYRTTFDAPEGSGARVLYFAEVDGLPEVFVNGKRLNCVPAGAPVLKSRIPFTVDVAGALRSGRNVVAVRVDHARITDLNLGGLLRPVFLVGLRP